MTRSPRSVAEILDALADQAAGGTAVSVGDIADTFGARTFGPAIMLPALLEITPVGAIPGVPTTLAAIIALVAVQKMVGRAHLWIPGFVERRTISAGKVNTAVEKLRPLAGFMDRHFHRRFRVLTRRPFSQVAAAIVLILCLAVPFLEVLPFASSLPMLAIACIGLAVLVGDGLLMSFALAASLAALGAIGTDYVDGGLSDTEAVDGLVKQDDIDALEDTAKAAGETAKDVGTAAAETVQDAGEDVAEDVADAVSGD